MKSKYITAEMSLKAEFYDVDSMKVVYHGNYVRYYEQIRCVLLDKIGYNYNEMEKSGYIWPVVSMDLKYIKPLIFNQSFLIRATLLEYENRIKIAYKIFNKESGKIMNKGNTVQMAVDMSTQESQLVSPARFVQLVEKKLASELENQ